MIVRLVKSNDKKKTSKQTNPLCAFPPKNIKSKTQTNQISSAFERFNIRYDATLQHNILPTTTSEFPPLSTTSQRDDFPLDMGLFAGALQTQVETLLEIDGGSVRTPETNQLLWPCCGARSVSSFILSFQPSHFLPMRAKSLQCNAERETEREPPTVTMTRSHNSYLSIARCWIHSFCSFNPRFVFCSVCPPSLPRIPLDASFVCICPASLAYQAISICSYLHYLSLACVCPVWMPREGRKIQLQGYLVRLPARWRLLIIMICRVCGKVAAAYFPISVDGG